MNLIGVRVALVAFCFAGFIHAAYAEEQTSAFTKGVSGNSIDFCKSFADKAAESKRRRHKKELLDLKSEIEVQLQTLEQKAKQLQALTAMRDEYRAAVSANLVKIYTNVEPDVAALQLEKLSVEMASEVLQRLNPKVSGEIITAMDVKLASRVVKLMLADTAKLKSEVENP